MNPSELSARQRLEFFLSTQKHFTKRSLGQNFLINDQVIQKIVDVVKGVNPQHLIEIGPGTGALTDLFKETFPSMELVEFDHELAQYWRENGMTVHEEDALRLDWGSLIQERKRQKFETIVLVSNLPYQISSSLVIERSMDNEPLQAMVLMFQKEVAERIRAQPRTPQYGMLSVVSQSFWKIQKVCEASPRDFNPAPKVASRVLFFESSPQVKAENRGSYLKFVKTSFSYRRKLLKKNLGQLNYSEGAVLEAFTSLRLNEKVRAEELSVKEFLNLYEHLNNSRQSKS